MITLHRASRVAAANVVLDRGFHPLDQHNKISKEAFHYFYTTCICVRCLNGKCHGMTLINKISALSWYRTIRLHGQPRAYTTSTLSANGRKQFFTIMCRQSLSVCVHGLLFTQKKITIGTNKSHDRHDSCSSTDVCDLLFGSAGFSFCRAA